MEPWSYEQALAYLYHFADFERSGTFARDPEDNLARMRTLLAAVGNPHEQYTTTHIAGTKGKGSTARLVAAALTASDIRTGLYAQPDLHTMRERMQIDGAPITESTVALLLAELAQAIAQLPQAVQEQLITFEVSTALAFMAFAHAGVQHAVIEVGLGGRLDPTNVIMPLVGGITAISLDHTAILGSTEAAIAREKAGIIKAGMAVVTSARHPDALAVIKAVCAERGASLTTVGPLASDADYRYPPPVPLHAAHAAQLVPPPFNVQTPTGERTLQIALLGAFQQENATAALAILDALQARGVPVTPAGVTRGLRSATWPGRLEVVAERPWVVIDGAHNTDSLLRLADALDDTFIYRRRIWVVGLLRDKDAAGMATVLTRHPERTTAIIATASQQQRSLAPADLAAFCTVAGGPPVQVVETSATALVAALAIATPEDLICVCGSLYLAGEALRWSKTHLDGSLAANIVIPGVDHIAD